MFLVSMFAFASFAQDKISDFNGAWIGPASVIEIKEGVATSFSYKEYGIGAENNAFVLKDVNNEIVMINRQSIEDGFTVKVKKSESGIKITFEKEGSVLFEDEMKKADDKTVEEKKKQFASLKRLVFGKWTLENQTRINSETKEVLESIDAKDLPDYFDHEHADGTKDKTYNLKQLDLCPKHGSVISNTLIGKFTLDSENCVLGLQQCQGDINDKVFAPFEIDREKSNSNQLVIKIPIILDEVEMIEVLTFKRKKESKFSEDCTQEHSNDDSSRDHKKETNDKDESEKPLPESDASRY